MAERRLFTLRAPAFASRGKGRAHRVFHPLCGATLGTLTRLALQGGVSAERAHVMAIAFAMAALRLPFTAAEAACERARARVDYPAPVFVVGHWRSGTTHLTNVLSRSGAFATLSPIAVGLPAEALGLGRVMAPLIEQFFPRTRLIDDLALAPDLPQEDELAMANLSTLSCNHGIYFPDRLEREFERGVFGAGVGAGEMAAWAGRLEAYVAKMTRAGGSAAVADPQSCQQCADAGAAGDLAGGAVHSYPSRSGGGVRVFGADVCDAGAGVVAGAG